tara:strand:- start:429 stop:1463 length:1035 start_codon:yes stop_codon:yes gene_type:complete
MKNYSNIKFFIGPMSKLTVDAVGDFCNNNSVEIGLIPSRRQIEYDGGYVCNWKTSDFSKYAKNISSKIILQRDHGGINQCSNTVHDNDMKIYTAHASFKEDADSGFDLIHIDPWKKYRDIEEAAEETVRNIKFISEINESTMFEVGTEEAIRPYQVEDIEKFTLYLEKNLSKKDFLKIKYLVIQAGTRISGTRNIGKFDSNRCKKMIDFCKNSGFLSKEHNGDYLNIAQMKKRFDLGLDAINVAPEFGVSESRVILNEIKNKERADLFDKFFNLVYESKKWVKWLPSNFKISSDEDRHTIVKVAGHYVFSKNEFYEITSELGNINNKIKKAHTKRLEKFFRSLD